jgi:putative transposase
MTMPRWQLVVVAVTRYYHYISGCVRRAFLCGEGVTHRKAWIEARLELLAKHFALSVCGFAMLDINLHVLCRLGPGVSDGWSDEDVVRRWMAI